MRISHLITAGLGYCCEFAFFSRFKHGPLIAARLGVSLRAVRYHLSDYQAGCFSCEGKENCLTRRLQSHSSTSSP